VNIPRRDPVRLEQATIDCPECGELLAIVEALDDGSDAIRAEVIYLWHPGKEEDGAPPPPRCHENGVTSFQAHSAYCGDRCSDYRTATVDTYTWGDAVRTADWRTGPQDDHLDEPYLDPVDEQTQMAL
jgi:hypothetical protein